MFKTILENVVTNCSGAVGAVLMGYDGIPVDQFRIDESTINLDLIAVEYSNIAKEIRKAADVLNTGSLQEVAIKTDDYYVVLHALTDDYFVALVIDRNGNFGQGRYLLMREATNLRQALL